MLEPDRTKFAADPFGYSALAWHKWGTARIFSGYSADPKDFPASTDLKSPIFWLTQAHALSEAATAVFSKQPDWETMPLPVRSMCDSQYCAAGIMLVGYSLEICLKGLLILTKGVDSYTKDERQFQHHKLDVLAGQLLSLSAKEKAILRVLTHFTEWAGRYPDPGTGRDAKAEEIFSLSEQFQVAGRDLFALAARVMKHTQVVINGCTAEE